MQQMYKYLVDDPTVRLTLPQALRLAMLRMASRSAAGIRPDIDSALIRLASQVEASDALGRLHCRRCQHPTPYTFEIMQTIVV